MFGSDNKRFWTRCTLDERTRNKTSIIKKATLFLLIAAVLCIAAPITGVSKCTIREDKTILVNGKPFFMNGIYYRETNYSATQQKADLQLFATSGFNTVHITQGSTQFWQDAASLGLYLVPETISDDVINSLKSQPSAIVWNLGDDIHAHQSIAQVQAANARVHTLDPDHLTTEVFYDPTAGLPYAPYADMIWFYRYPVYNKASGSDLGIVRWITEGLESAITCKVGIPQAYNWGNGNRFPDAHEYRNMVYQYLVHNVRGILPYSFSDAGRLPDVAPQLWNAIVQCSAEINALAPVLLDGKFTHLVSDGDNMQLSYWEYQNAVYVVAVNISMSNQSVSATLPVNAGAKMEPFFTGQSSGCTLSGQQFSGSFAAGEVEVYRVTESQTTVTDVTPPTAPTNLSTTTVTSTSCTVSWTESTDSAGVTGYEIFIAGVSAGTSTSTTFNATNLICATIYSLTVKARDAAGNWSAASVAAPVTTQACVAGAEVVVNDDSPRITYAGSWTSGSYNTDPGNIHKDEHLTNATDASASLTFTGSSISWIGTSSANRGIVDVYIDNVKVTSADAYSAAFEFQKVLYTNSFLSSGPHTIKLVNTGTKNTSSSGTYLIVDAFKYNNPGTTPTIGSRYLKSFQQQFAFVNAQGMITINLSLAGFTRVRISDSNGRLVYSTMAAGKLSMPTSAIKPGVYFVSGQCDGLTRAHKVAISR